MVLITPLANELFWIMSAVELNEAPLEVISALRQRRSFGRSGSAAITTTDYATFLIRS